MRPFWSAIFTASARFFARSLLNIEVMWYLTVRSVMYRSLAISLLRIPEASRDFEHALQIDPEYGPALRGSGICRLHAGKYLDAAKDLEKAVAAEPNVPRDYIFLGMAYAAIDQREPARAAFQHALSLDPQGSARAHFHLANLDIRENRPGEAIRELDAYLAAVPDAPDKEKVLALRSQLRQKK